MTVKSSEKHIHKFKRLRYKSGNEIFFCCLPDCNVKINPALALGKRSICWRCGEPFILDEYSLRLAKPHCNNCHKPKSEKIKIDEVINTELEKQGFEPLSLSERLNQTLNQAKQQTTTEEEEL